MKQLSTFQHLSSAWTNSRKRFPKMSCWQNSKMLSSIDGHWENSIWIPIYSCTGVIEMRYLGTWNTFQSFEDHSSRVCSSWNFGNHPPRTPGSRKVLIACKRDFFLDWNIQGFREETTYCRGWIICRLLVCWNQTITSSLQKSFCSHHTVATSSGPRENVKLNK